jgi:hypothetical protein
MVAFRGFEAGTAITAIADEKEIPVFEEKKNYAGRTLSGSTFFGRFSSIFHSADGGGSR